MKLLTATLFGFLIAGAATAAVAAIVLPGSIVHRWDKLYIDNAHVQLSRALVPHSEQCFRQIRRGVSLQRGVLP